MNQITHGISNSALKLALQYMEAIPKKIYRKLSISC